MLRNLLDRLAGRQRGLRRQRRRWLDTHERGHAEAARRDARAIRRLRRRISHVERERRRRTPLACFDSVTVSEIPASAPAVLGYVGGIYRTWPEIVARFPHAHRISVAISATEDADMLDVEPGDATPQQVPAWVRRQHSRGLAVPIVYGSVEGSLPEVLNELLAAGIGRHEVRIVSAHYNYVPHLCGPDTCGLLHSTTADGTQYTDHALGRNLDESLLAHDFFLAA